MEFNATFLISAISFVLFTLIMNKIFYKPLEKTMNERQNFIDKTLSEAKFSSDKADAILKDRDEKLAQSVVQAKKTVSDKTNEANEEGKNIINNAKQQTAEQTALAKENLYNESKKLEEDLAPEVERIARLITSKVLKENLESVS